jgi:transcriptional regulator with XRE-family HTH domain
VEIPKNLAAWHKSKGPERVRGWRDHAGLTQAQVSAAAGVTSAAASQWERRVECAVPTHANLTAFVEACGITLAEFWSRIPPKKSRTRKAA